MFNEVNMKSSIVLISFVISFTSVCAQDTLTKDLAYWFVKTSLYDNAFHLIKKKMIFDETVESYLKLYTELQDSGFVKLTPADSVYIDALPSHQILEIELLEKSQQYVLDSTFNEIEKSVKIVLFTYDSLEILSIDSLKNYYEIKFRVINPKPTPFYITWYNGEDARKALFESTRYVRFKNGRWELDRYPFRE